MALAAARNGEASSVNAAMERGTQHLCAQRFALPFAKDFGLENFGEKFPWMLRWAPRGVPLANVHGALDGHAHFRLPYFPRNMIRASAPAAREISGLAGFPAAAGPPAIAHVLNGEASETRTTGR